MGRLVGSKLTESRKKKLVQSGLYWVFVYSGLFGGPIVISGILKYFIASFSLLKYQP